MSSDREEQIRQRAYALWEKDGGKHGRHDHHWAQAVREIEGDITSTAKRVVRAVRTKIAAIGGKAPPEKAPVAKKAPTAKKSATTTRSPAATKASTAKAPAAKASSPAAAKTKPARAVAKAPKPVARKTKAG